MTTRNVYIGLLATFLLTFGFNLTSLFLPQWVQFKSAAPYSLTTSYGLFQKCSTLTDDCRRFPAQSWGDCDHDPEGSHVNVCLEWRVASGFIIVSSWIGLWIVAMLATVLYTGERWQQHGWKHVLGLMGVYAALQVVGMALIAHVVNQSALFLYRSSFGLSFIFSNVSWGLAAWVVAGALTWYHYRGGTYIELE